MPLPFIIFPDKHLTPEGIVSIGWVKTAIINEGAEHSDWAKAYFTGKVGIGQTGLTGLLPQRQYLWT